MEQPRISIVVPVYNVAPYLQECLDSLTGQTMRDIEVLCVDDCSTDGSAELLRQAAAADDRIHVQFHTENRTAAVCRKEGVLASHGQYLLFVDPDDRLHPDACGILLQHAGKQQVDILHFQAQAFGEADIAPERIRQVNRMLTVPHLRKEEALLASCFGEEPEFSFQLWNKLYSGDLVRRAMRCFPDGAFPKAQDLLAFFIILYFAKSYCGVRTEPLYDYRVGVGVTGGQTLTRKQIDGYAAQALIAPALRRFLASQGNNPEAEDCVDRIQRRLLRDSVSRLRKQIAPQDFTYAWEAYCLQWGAAEIVAELAHQNLFREANFLPHMQQLPSLQYAPRETRCIGTFYHSIVNGGAQRVVASLVTLWVSMGYRVVLFTDSEPTPEDYPIPESVKRIVLPAPDYGDHPAELFPEREKALYQAVQQEQIDLFVYHAWVAPAIFWDMLAVKTAGAAFFVHCHSVFSMLVMRSPLRRAFVCSPLIYAMADGVVTLSEADAAYWRPYQPNTFTVVNPLPFPMPERPDGGAREHTLLWVGRISNEKNPVQAVEILNRVRQQVPDARLVMVGSGSEALEEAVHKRIVQLGLEDAVTLPGFCQDVMPYYHSSSLLLCTSEYEGFGMTLLEAQSCGLPVITYDMPYLTILATGQGSVSVPMHDKDAAARAVVRLLLDEEERQRLGMEAYRNVAEHFAIDLAAQWRPIIASTSLPRPEGTRPSAERVMLDTLRSHTLIGLNNARGAQQPAEDRFIPLPAKGPCKKLRKKFCTFMNILILQGPAAAWKLCVLRQ